MGIEKNYAREGDNQFRPSSNLAQYRLLINWSCWKLGTEHMKGHWSESVDSTFVTTDHFGRRSFGFCRRCNWFSTSFHWVFVLVQWAFVLVQKSLRFSPAGLRFRPSVFVLLGLETPQNLFICIALSRMVMQSKPPRNVSLLRSVRKKTVNS